MSSTLSGQKNATFKNTQNELRTLLHDTSVDLGRRMWILVRGLPSLSYTFHKTNFKYEICKLLHWT